MKEERELKNIVLIAIPVVIICFIYIIVHLAQCTQ